MWIPALGRLDQLDLQPTGPGQRRANTRLFVALWCFQDHVGLEDDIVLHAITARQQFHRLVEVVRHISVLVMALHKHAIILSLYIAAVSLVGRIISSETFARGGSVTTKTIAAATSSGFIAPSRWARFFTLSRS